MQKLAISKKIMDASDNIKPGQAQGSLPMTENINASYNIPQDMIQQPVPQQPDHNKWFKHSKCHNHNP